MKEIRRREHITELDETSAKLLKSFDPDERIRVRERDKELDNASLKLVNIFDPDARIIV